MKATGVVRRIDDLGRIVIPKEIRKVLRIKEGDPLEVFTDREGQVILKKYSPIGELSEFAAGYAETLSKTTGHIACITDKDTIIAVAGGGKKEYLEQNLSEEIEKIMEKVRVETGLAPEDFEIKRLRKSLANCNVETSFITINPDIVAYDEKTIEYVILHEFCHLKYKIRTKNFWKMVKTYMPNYEQYGKEINNLK